jgi:hypothetical protein
MTRRSGIAALVLGAGLVVIASARLVLPAAPPLYDGVVPIVRYLWLDPPAGQPGGAKGASADIAVRSGKSPLVAVATAELEPQAQIFAQPGGLNVPSGARTIHVAIEPIPSEGSPADGQIDGNVYRISVLDESGTALTAPASARVSVVLRATDPAQAEATIARFSGGVWQPLKTSASGFGGSFLSIVMEFGDFAVILPGLGPSVAVSQYPTLAPATAALPSRLGPASPAVATSSGDTTSGGGSNGPGLIVPLIGAIILVTLAMGLGYAGKRRRQSYRGARQSRRH